MRSVPVAHKKGGGLVDIASQKPHGEGNRDLIRDNIKREEVRNFGELSEPQNYPEMGHERS